jgi:N-acetylglucosaminyldiphosphoundecaprenol N-acetyl-beta-D-mannosaminyltransferase
MAVIKGNKILGVTIAKVTKQDILEKIKKYISQPGDFFHIVSLNPENLVVAQENSQFKKVLETAQIKLIDGAGVILAARILSVPLGERLTGVELAENLLNLAKEMSLRVLLIGGRPNLAETLAKCYEDRLTQAKFKGYRGIRNIKNPKKGEEEKIFNIVAYFKPHLVLVAFGSPAQELWLARHRRQLRGVICAGVGGAFDYLSGRLLRAPSFLQKIGLEWLFRLIRQPWRWWRQLRLIKFLWLVAKEKWKKKF